MSSITKLRQRDQLLLLRAIASLIKAEQPLDRALSQLASQWRGQLAQTAGEIATKVSHGQSLEQALVSGQGRTERMLHATIEAGRQTGQLHAAIESWSTLQQSRTQARRSLVIAMIYPMLLFMVIAGSLLFTLHNLTPHYRNAFDSILGRQPTWMQFAIWFSDHLLLTLALLTLLTAGLPAWWFMRTLRSSDQSPPAELADRWYVHAHIARLAECFVKSHRPGDVKLDALLLAAGRPSVTESSDRTTALTASNTDSQALINGHDDAQVYAWLGRETALALMALRDGVMPIDQVRDLLATVAVQLQRMADVRWARNTQWLPMVAATSAGVAVAIMYVGLIYGPWLTLFRALSH